MNELPDVTLHYQSFGFLTHDMRIAAQIPEYTLGASVVAFGVYCDRFAVAVQSYVNDVFTQAWMQFYFVIGISLLDCFHGWILPKPTRSMNSGNPPLEMKTPPLKSEAFPLSHEATGFRGALRINTVYRSLYSVPNANASGRACGWGDWQVNAFPADALTCLG
jgi:hypothetical protein